MYVVTSEEMRKIDAYAIQKIGLPSLVLMENAGRGAAKAAVSGEQAEIRRWAVLVGKGNNGGDGVAASRHLMEWGFSPTIIYVDNPDSFQGEAAIQRDIAAAFGVPSVIYEEGEVNWADYDGIVDALLGTGSSGAPRKKYASLIIEANESVLPITAMDIPSGLDPDTGQVHTPCIQAERTAALAYTKRGLEQYPGLKQAGEVSICSIGIMADLASEHDVRTFRTDAAMLEKRFGIYHGEPAREADSNKGTYGHVLTAAGTRLMAGAGLMSATASLRIGAGLVTWAVPERVLDNVVGRQPEIMLTAFADEGTGDWSAVKASDVVNVIENKQAAVLGPGMGRWKKDRDWLEKIWKTSSCPLVIDADGLNILSETNFSLWKKRSAPVILTPHPGEMARLCGCSVKEVQQDRIGIARQFAEKNGVVVVLKGARTVTAAPDGSVSINTTGNPKMATGGAGDVLTGVIAGLLAQGFEAESAAVYGVYLHGLAGDEAAQKRSRSRAVAAGDIIDEL
ncbi:NAD(P)H-hydrate dehydratase [Alkalicoccus halolimnae]|uniref:Bifunctional NAD(P)H-hydrate repair enzyme n=1 Tax=Alkalicoccus halolimnae TaxID=1667239 RepID=A0A5C7FGJ3_9BACI|nr:NAD(P)H-hydrate dehydratase [Alkalicoccus halolimnae]TXF85394.1 NAD(P)H-hydrate dehydratase [Alkalicoccus halolimnae]